MKRASFIQSLSLLVGGFGVSQLPFKDGTNHIIVGSNIQTVDKLLSNYIKDKKHLKMFQHMMPNWLRSNRVDISRPYMPYDSSLYTLGLFIFLSWNTNDGLTVAHLIEDYPNEQCSQKVRERYEKRLMAVYNSFKETQIA